ncbi:MAG: type II toxin-antitoxin system prevent-host-death family antitoxin [Bryobacteraceae bacterium]
MEIGAFEAKNKLGMLLDRVEDGGEITITRHGKPVARLVPNATRIDKLQARTALERIRARAANLKEVFDWVIWRLSRLA